MKLNAAMRVGVAIALATTLVPAVATSASESVAKAFLRRLGGAPPQQDQLAELRTENPEAYALVKALLTKRSLGLLDPRHPSASFSSKPPAAQDDAERGPEVFQKFATPGESLATSSVSTESHAVYPEAAAAPAHHDWLNWKPQSSAMDDDAMVKNVLGAVAELKGAPAKTGLLSRKRAVAADASPLAADAEALGMDTSASASTATSSSDAAVTKTAEKGSENSYLKSIDFGDAAKEVDQFQPRAPSTNSYLKGIDLNGDSTPAATKPVESLAATHAAQRAAGAEDSGSDNPLASFSWGDDMKQPEQRTPPPTAAVQLKATTAAPSALLSWLGVVKKQPPPQVQKAAPQEKNSYAFDLSA